jgi:hypothetical protein
LDVMSKLDGIEDRGRLGLPRMCGRDVGDRARLR